MSNQSAGRNYTLKQIQGLGARWISESTFMGFIQQYLLEESHVTGKLRRFYKRLLPPLLTLWLMLFQRLNTDHSCDAAVSEWIGGLATEQALEVCENSSAYCQARQRLPWGVVKDSLKHTARCLREELGEKALWLGRKVGLLDGSTLRLMATPVLHEHYGVSSNQHGENHWPIMRILAAFHLFSGGLEAAVEAPYATGELSMVAALMGAMDAGWIWVGDMNFGAYRVAQTAQCYLQDVVLRMRWDRVKGWIGNQRMDSGESRPVVWRGGHNQHAEPGLPLIDIPGRLIYLRVERPGFRPIDLYLFTTLTDPSQYPTQAILDLYGRRWNVELDLRHLKTTLQMEELTGKSVDMVRKELWVGFLAYNLIRGLMGLAALKAQLSPLGLSFARSLRRILSAAPRLLAAQSPEALAQAWDFLLTRVAKCTLPRSTKTRFEPRRVWGKPRVFPTIKGSREQARAEDLAKLAADKS